MQPNPTLCDTGDMIVVHRVFRRELRAMPAMVTAVSAGDVPRAQRVGAHVIEMLTYLHRHHTGEDELLWPHLFERDPGDHQLFERMIGQHDVIATGLDDAERLVPRWQAAADRDTATTLAEVLRTTSTALDEHLAVEESHVLPLAAQHVTATEWDELAHHGMSGIPRSRLPIFLGHLLEEATPQERDAFLGKVPRVGRLAYRLVGRRKYEREVADLRRDLPTMASDRSPNPAASSWSVSSPAGAVSVTPWSSMT